MGKMMRASFEKMDALVRMAVLKNWFALIEIRIAVLKNWFTLIEIKK